MCLVAQPPAWPLRSPWNAGMARMSDFVFPVLGRRLARLHPRLVRSGNLTFRVDEQVCYNARRS